MIRGNVRICAFILAGLSAGAICWFDQGCTDSRPGKLTALAGVCKGIAALSAAPPDDPVLVALADVARRYLLPLSAIDELIEGCELDVHGTRYATFDELVGYCRRVAGTVGRLSLAVFGTDDPSRAVPTAPPAAAPLEQQAPLELVMEDPVIDELLTSPVPPRWLWRLIDWLASASRFTSFM